MNAPLFPPFPPFPLNPAVGQRFGSWVWSGAQWIPAGGGAQIINIQVFKTVGQTLTYIPSPGLITAIVECIGGGGAGGQAGPPPNVEWALGGGGGGSGGYSRKILPASLVLGGVNVIVGAGGPASNEVSAAASPTSFGALCVANGGEGGNGNNASSGGDGQGGQGAAPGVGDVAMPGNGGVAGPMLWYNTAVTAQLVAGGIGGSMWGGAVPSPSVQQGAGAGGGQPWPNTGAGGSGASLNQMAAGSTAALGGNGASGICIVTEYCMGDAGGGCGPGAPISITGCGPGWGDPC